MSLVQTVGGLGKALQSVREKSGEGWGEVVAMHRPIIQRRMSSMGTFSPVLAILPLVAQMRASGEDPEEIMAVAAEMAESSQRARFDPDARSHGLAARR